MATIKSIGIPTHDDAQRLAHDLSEFQARSGIVDSSNGIETFGYDTSGYQIRHRIYYDDRGSSLAIDQVTSRDTHNRIVQMDMKYYKQGSKELVKYVRYYDYKYSPTSRLLSRKRKLILG